MKKINIWLMGGFGNVLFHLFLAHLLQKKGNIVTLCTLLTQKNIITKLLGWTIHDSLYHDLKGSINTKRGSIFPLLLLPLSTKIDIGREYSFFYRSLDNILDNPSSNIFGYFQLKGFLEKNKKELVFFSQGIAKRITKDIPKETIMNTKQACIHIRLGDSGWAKDNIDYYTKALETLPDNMGITVVTDSPQDAKNLLSSYNVSFSKGGNALEDFYLLFSSDIIICAPSTFSWWAIHCSSNAKKIVMPQSLHDKLGSYIDSGEIILI